MSISLSSSTNYYSNSGADSFLNYKKNTDQMAQIIDLLSNKPLRGDAKNLDSIKKKQQVTFYAINSGYDKNSNLIKPKNLEASVPQTTLVHPETIDQTDSIASQGPNNPIQEAVTFDLDAAEASKTSLIRKRRGARSCRINGPMYRVNIPRGSVTVTRGHPEYNRQVLLAVRKALSDVTREMLSEGLPTWLVGQTAKKSCRFIP